MHALANSFGEIGALSASAKELPAWRIFVIGRRRTDVSHRD